MLTDCYSIRNSYNFAALNRKKSYLRKINTKRVIILTLVGSILTSCKINFNQYSSKTNLNATRYESQITLAPFSAQNQYSKPTMPSNMVFLEKDYTGFKEALAFKESQGRYGVVNKFGYLGKYQFGKGTLELIGIRNPQDFLSDPVLQERAFYANLSRNKWILRREIKRYSNTWMRGTYVTESGILAAAHLVGPGAVKKYLRSYGTNTFEDAFGTTVVDYLKKFKSFDVSVVEGNRKARA